MKESTVWKLIGTIALILICVLLVRSVLEALDHGYLHDEGYTVTMRGGSCEVLISKLWVPCGPVAQAHYMEQTNAK